jgi:hypothetical protein
VDRTIEVQAPVVARLQLPTSSKGAAWVEALHELTRQVETGKVYDRDLAAIGDGLQELLAALTRRRGAHRR